MKTKSKLLVLLLSIALVLTAFMVVVGASSGAVAEVDGKKYADLTDAIDSVIASEKSGKITLLSDASLEYFYVITKDLTINLGGNTLTVVGDSFSVKGNASLTITGSGTIITSGTLASTESDNDGANPKVNIIGTGSGIDIFSEAGKVTYAASGEFNIENVDIFTESVPDGVAVLETAAGSVATYNIKASAIYSSGGSIPSTCVITLRGTAKLNVSYSNLESSRSVINFLEYKATGLAIKIDNSYLASRGKNSGGSKAGECGIFGWYATITCEIEINDSVLEGSYRPILLNGSKPGKITLNNSHIKQNGIVPNNDIMRSFPIVVNKGSSITAPGNSGIGHSDSESKSMFLTFMEGSRMNYGLYNSIFVNGKNQGGRFGDIEEIEGVMTVTYSELTLENEKFAVVYDPIGDPDAPYVVVRRTFDVDENGEKIETTQKGIDLGDVLYYGDMSGVPATVIWNNGTYTDAKPTHTGVPIESTLGWNKNGIVYGVNVGGNSALALERDELNEKNNDTTVVLGKNNGVMHTDYQVLVSDIEFAIVGGEIEGSFGIHTRGSGNAGDYAAIKIRLRDGLISQMNAPVGEGVPINDGWNRISIVVYTDKGTGASSKGRAFVYFNGEFLFESSAYNIKGTNGDIAYLWGPRFDLESSESDLGASIYFDNAMFRGFRTYQDETEIATSGATKNAASYITNAGIPLNTIDPVRPITIGKVGFASVDEALAASELVGVLPKLEADLDNELVTKNGSIVLNGHTINLADGSIRANVSFDTKGNPEILSFNAIYSNLKVNVEWFVGDTRDIAALKNKANYVKTEVYVGEAPVYDGETIILTEKAGKDFYTANVIGWAYSFDAEEPETIDPITVADVINNSGSTLKIYPVYSEITKLDVADNEYLVLNSKGNIDRLGKTENGVMTSLDWYGNENSVNLKYGETFVLLSSNVEFVGNFAAERAETDGDKTFGFDLNGNAMVIDATQNETGKTPDFINVKTGETVNFYSSVSGASVMLHGMAEASIAKTLSGGKLISVDGSGSNDVITNISNETNNNTHVNIGTVKSFGNTYSGKNLTVYGDCLVETNNGDKTCSVNVDGIVFVKAINNYSSVFSNKCFNGQLNVTDSTFLFPIGGTLITGSFDGVTDGNGDGKINAYDIIVSSTNFTLIDNCVRVAANALFDGCTIIMNENSTSSKIGNVIDADYVWGEILFENCATNGRINVGKIRIAAKIGNGCLVYNPNAWFVDGVKEATFVGEMAIGNTGSDTVTVKYVSGFTKNSETDVVYSYGEFTVSTVNAGGTADLTLPEFDKKYVDDEHIYTVTFLDAASGVISSLDYAEGSRVAVPTYSDIASGSVITSSFTGKFSPELTVAVSDVTYVPVYENVAGVSGLKESISLGDAFYVNLYIPKTYAEVLTSVAYGETVLEIKPATVEGVDYLVVTVAKDADSVTDSIVLELTFTEGVAVATKQVELSIVSYAEEVLQNTGSKYSDAERKLVWYAVNYANEAYKYFEGGNNDALDVILNTYSDAKGESSDRVFAGVLETLPAPSVIASATFKLDCAPKLTLNVKAGFEGKITVKTERLNVEFTVTASDTVVIVEEMLVSDLSDTFEISVSGTVDGEEIAENGTYNYATYAQYHESRSESSKASSEALAVIYALYDLVNCIG